MNCVRFIVHIAYTSKQKIVVELLQIIPQLFQNFIFLKFENFDIYLDHYQKNRIISQLYSYSTRIMNFKSDE
jgi:hypothetical protein